MLKEEKVLLQRLAIVAIPVMIQNLVQSGVGFLDTLMIGQLGETEVAAVGGANQYFFFIQIVSIAEAPYSLPNSMEQRTP